MCVWGGINKSSKKNFLLVQYFHSQMHVQKKLKYVSIKSYKQIFLTELCREAGNQKWSMVGCYQGTENKLLLHVYPWVSKTVSCVRKAGQKSDYVLLGFIHPKWTRKTGVGGEWSRSVQSIGANAQRTKKLFEVMEVF